MQLMKSMDKFLRYFITMMQIAVFKTCYSNGKKLKMYRKAANRMIKQILQFTTARFGRRFYPFDIHATASRREDASLIRASAKRIVSITNNHFRAATIHDSAPNTTSSRRRSESPRPGEEKNTVGIPVDLRSDINCGTLRGSVA